MLGKRRKGSKGRAKEGLDTALREYADAEAKLAEFEMTHDCFIGELEDLQSAKREAQQRVETEALEVSTVIKKGKYQLIVDHGYIVSHKVGARRKVDPVKLLQRYPEIWQWKGLFSVVVGKFDAAVESKQIESGDVESLVSTTPTNSIEITKQEQ